MSDASQPARRIVVIGGGLSGLAAAHRIVELRCDLEVILVEASDRLGGVIQTQQRDGYLIERSADSFLTSLPWAADLCRRIGFDAELIATNPSERKALVVRAGKLREVPAGFVLMTPQRSWPIVTSPLLSPWGKLRLLYEYFVPARRDETDESLASFARRRLGQEAYERLVQPLVSGIYSADPEKLSMAAALPQMVRMEREHGGLIRATRRTPASNKTTSENDSGARYSKFVAPRRGMESLVEAIAAQLPASVVKIRWPAHRIEQRAGGWIVHSESDTPPIDCCGVIVATPSSVAARLLRPLDAPLADELSPIELAGTAVVSLGYRRDQLASPLRGFGFVVPAIERRRILAASFSSNKFPGRAPEGRVLIRVFIGGALQSELLALDDNQLQRLAEEELAELLAIRGAPELVEIARWPTAMPQYHVGHLQRVERISQRVAGWKGLELAGNAYSGVGVPQCIHSGEQAAERIWRAIG